MSTTIALLTAEEYGHLPDTACPTELVRGRVVAMNPPLPLYGYVCSNVAFLLRDFVSRRDLGRVLSNDSGVITARDPDTVRGADVAYYSFERVPKGPLPEEYFPVPPELVVEVLSPGDRRSEILAKVAEYLAAGVIAVCVLDPRTQTAQIFYDDEPVVVLEAGDELAFPKLLEGFSAKVGRLFE
jgi:Uma2 family endonuclease